MLYATDLEAANAVKNANNAIVSLEKAIWSAIDSGRLKSTDLLYSKWLGFNQEVSQVKNTYFFTDVGELEAYQDLQNKAFAIADELQKTTGVSSEVTSTTGVIATPKYVPSPVVTPKDKSDNLLLLVGVGLALYLIIKRK